MALLSMILHLKLPWYPTQHSTMLIQICLSANNEAFSWFIIYQWFLVEVNMCLFHWITYRMRSLFAASYHKLSRILLHYMATSHLDFCLLKTRVYEAIWRHLPAPNCYERLMTRRPLGINNKKIIISHDSVSKKGRCIGSIGRMSALFLANKVLFTNINGPVLSMDPRSMTIWFSINYSP